MRRAGEGFIGGHATGADSGAGKAATGHIQQGLRHMGADFRGWLTPGHADSQGVRLTAGDDSGVIIRGLMCADDRLGAGLDGIPDGCFSGGQIGPIVDQVIGHIGSQASGAHEGANIGAPGALQRGGVIQVIGLGFIHYMADPTIRISGVRGERDFGNGPSPWVFDPQVAFARFGPSTDQLANADPRHGAIGYALNQGQVVVGLAQAQHGD